MSDPRDYNERIDEHRVRRVTYHEGGRTEWIDDDRYQCGPVTHPLDELNAEARAEHRAAVDEHRAECDAERREREYRGITE